MTASTRAQLTTEVSTNFPDNTTGLITPAIARTTFGDFIASFAVLADNNTFAPASGDVFTINPAASSYAKGFTITQTTPTTGSTTGPFSANLISLNYQGEIAFTGTVNGLNNTNSAGLRVNMTTGGTNPGSSGALGDQAINAGLFHIMDTVAGTQANFPDRIAILSMAYCNVNHGDAHGLYGANLNAQVDSGGVITHMIGVEPDMIISGTGTAAFRSAMSLVNAGAHRASSLDAAMRVGSAVAGGEWQNVIGFITTNGFINPPVSTTANFVTDNGATFTMGNIFNMPNVTVTTNILKFPNVTLSGPGVLTMSGTAQVAFGVHGVNVGVCGLNASSALFVALNPGGAGGHYTILNSPSGDSFFQARDTDNGAGDAKWGYLSNDVLQITDRAQTPVTGNWVKVDTNGLLAQAGFLKSASATAGIGYATGAGGTIAQASSRTTGVTINTVTGSITLVSAAGSATPATFTVTNSAVAATDIPKVVQKSGTDKYEIFVTAVAAGSFAITFFTTGGTTTETPVFNFAIIKGVTA